MSPLYWLIAKSDKDSSLLSLREGDELVNTLPQSGPLLHVTKQLVKLEMVFSSAYSTSALGPKSASVAGTDVSGLLAGWFSNTAAMYTGWEN